MPSKRTLCCSVKTGTLVVAILEIIGSVLWLILGTIFLVSGPRDALWVGLCGFIIGVCILTLGFAALLISALRQNKPRRCLPWLIFRYIVTVLSFLGVLRGITSISSYQNSLFVVSLLGQGFAVGVQCYFISIVQRFMNSALANSV